MTGGSSPRLAPRARPERSWRTKALLLALLCLLVYNANLRYIGAGDTLPARYLPLALWRYATLELDPIARLVAHGHPSLKTWLAQTGPGSPGNLLQPWTYWIFSNPHQHLVSLYPIVAPVLVAPLYLPAVALLRAQGWQRWQVEWTAAVMEKLAASTLATIAVLVMYRLLSRDAARWSLPLTIAFAFGTNTWMISSQALWQHGAGELLVAVALLLVTSRGTPARLAALGAICVAMAANRPPDALLAAAILLFVVGTVRRAAAWLAAGAVVPLALLVVYNLTVCGNLAGGYGTVRAPGFFAHAAWTGIAGLLVSPARGLLVFSPFLVLVPAGLIRRLREPPLRALAALLAVAVVAQLVLYAKADWRAGTSWGPRWLTDTLPVLLWMLAPASLRLRPLARVALAVAIGTSIAVQAVGAFWYTGASDRALFASDAASAPDALRAFWQVGNAPFVAELRHPRPHGDLACSARGYLDRVGDAPWAETAPAPPVIASGTLLQGWALACGRSPAAVLLLVDGHVIGRTGQFAPRPDVAAAMHTTAPSAWRIGADTRGLAPGEHMLEIAVRAEPMSDIRIVSEQRALFASPPTAAPSGSPGGASGPTPAAADLAALANRAAALLRAHQSAAGYWLTVYTSEPRFATPRPEMNTFLTAVLVDLLTPVASERGLAAALEKARRHLASQIEPDGLVRYHGRPDGPTIGTLGCVITPDADDTALAWRIAHPPAGDPRRAAMLRALDRYRDSRGFYRTWLAPQERYQCLDPGHDPDPVDIGIQMHVLLMLAEIDPTAARPLCRAIAAGVSDERLWVYYTRAPIVPLLRTADLQRIGCAVAIPGERRARGVAGQADWLAAAHLLVDATIAARGLRPGDTQSALTLLAALGREDFAELRRNPPLLYHNDLTATTPRYYWSEDFGYALWLRLYDAARAAAERAPRARP